MASISSGSNLVASRYASAFLDMAAASGIVEKVEQDMRDMEQMIESSADLQSLIRNPLIDREQQKRAILAVAEKAGFQDLTRNFMGVLVRNRRFSILQGIIRAFYAELTRRRGGVEARIQTAYALTPAQTKALQEKLSKTMGSNVTLNVEVNKDLLGGMVITVGSLMIDDSVRRKLERLGRTMGAGSNENIELVKSA